VSTDDPSVGCADAACDPCTNAHGGVACSNGACAPSCDAGFGDCDGKPKNGCETDLDKTITDCGACGTVCTNAHGTTACTAGKCVPKCDAGWGDCNGNPNDGCGSALDTTSHCGACGTACTNAHGTTACTAGKCVPTCDAGWDDCNGDPNDGCETHVGVDPLNCGACNRKCSSTNVAALICAGGVCASTCDLGFANCNQPATGNDDGCEKNVTSDDKNCGGCGNACPSTSDAQECDQGGATQKVCGCSNNNECKWGTGTSPSCGSGLCTCNGTTCQPGEACKHVNNADVCTCYGGAACADGQSCCGNMVGCVDLQTDPQNCGACGHACAPGFNCEGGVCGCAGSDAHCDGGAPAGSFSCPQIQGPNKCVCNNGATTCGFGQRCLPDNSCG
jgi:hypothetical protein